MMRIATSLMIGGVAASLVACGDEPTAARRPTITISAEEQAAVNTALQDALSRLVPALGDETVTQRVRSALSSSATSLSDLDADAFFRTLGDASAALKQHTATDETAPIAESLRLVIEQVRAVTSQPAQGAMNGQP